MKTALVTGATRGIGRAAALALGHEGCWVVASGRDAEAGKALQTELEGLSGGVFAAGDLTAPETPEALVAKALEETGRLDALVNNAGIHHVATLVDTEPEDYDRVMNANLRAAVLLARAAIPAMQRGGGGVIVNVSSEAGLIGFPSQVAYNISKAGLVMLTKSIVADYARDGIRAVTVCPGTTRTPLVEGIIAQAADPGECERGLASIRPANRLGEVEEIAAAIAFAVSDRAGYMTGSEIVVDGGNVAVT